MYYDSVYINESCYASLLYIWHIGVGAQLTLGGRHFARKCMYEKLIKCAAKTGFEIQSYFPRAHEMKN